MAQELWGEREVACIPSGCCLLPCWIQKEASFLPPGSLLKRCWLEEAPMRGARCSCSILGFYLFLSSSSLETHDYCAKSRDTLFLYLLGKVDALVPLSLLADELSRWEPHFQIVLQQKWHSLDCLFSRSALSDLNAFSAVLYSQEIFLNARSPIAVICIADKLGTHI